MKLNRLKLINDVGKALPGIANGSVVLEGADSLAFLDGHIYSYNSAISVNVAESQNTGLKGIVKAQDFYNCITKLPGEEIDVTVNDSTWEIIDGKIKVEMKLLPSGDIFKRLESLKVDDLDWLAIDGKEFNDVLKVCLIKDTSSLNGVYFKGKEAISTNRWIINKCTLKSEYPEFWLSINSISELLKWSNFEKVKFAKCWAHFMSSDNVVFSVRTLALEGYPLDKIKGVYDRIMEKNSLASITLNENFYKAVQRASAFSNVVEEHDVVSVSFGKEVLVKGSRVSGNFEEVVEGMTTTFATPVEMKFDLNEFLSSEKFFTELNILSDSNEIDTTKSVHLSLKNPFCTKVFSSISE